MVDVQLAGRGIADAQVLAAMRIVPREMFVDDVLEEFGDRLCACDVAGLGEEFGVAGEELPPVLGGLFVPGENFFGGEDGLGHAGS